MDRNSKRDVDLINEAYEGNLDDEGYVEDQPDVAVPGNEAPEEITVWALYSSDSNGRVQGSPKAIGQFPKDANSSKVTEILRDDLELEGSARMYTRAEVIDLGTELEKAHSAIQQAKNTYTALSQMARREGLI